MDATPHAQVSRRAWTAAVIVTAIVTVIAVNAQRIAVGFSPGPWSMSQGPAGDPLPRTGPVVFVPYDERQRGYVTVKPEPLGLVMTLNANCAGKAGKSSSLDIQIAGQPGSVSYSTLGRAQGNFEGTTTAATKEPVHRFVSELRIPNPVATCNKDLDAMLAGRKYGEAQRGWARRFDDGMQVTLKLNCVEKDDEGVAFTTPGKWHETSTSVSFPVWLHCGPAAVHETTRGGGRPPVKTAGVQSAEVWVNPRANADYKGACPKTLNFGGSIDFAGASGTSARVRYRYRTHDNATSPVYEVTFDGSGRKNLHFWQREFGGSSPTGTLTAKGGASQPKVVDGFVQLEVLGNADQVTATDRMRFRLTCAAPGAPNRIKGGTARPDVP